MFTDSYAENILRMDAILRPDASFDVIKRKLFVGADELTFYYIDGLIKDETMLKIMQGFTSQKALPKSAEEFIRSSVTYVEADCTQGENHAAFAVMSGGAAVLGSTFCGAVIIDARTYPVRGVEEPESDKVMRGARDGFVETLIFNTALIRRRIRDTRLRVVYKNVGESSKTDIALVYIEGKADEKYVKWLSDKLDSIKTDSLTMGHQSLAECLVGKRWYNPFPKIRYTERPDTASAQILEGNVIILCDTSPDAMLLPTTVFDFLQETGDYYFPPFTGSYMRVLRHIIFWLTLFLVPLWYLFAKNPSLAPEWIAFALPREHGILPLALQLFLAEFVIDGLKLASMNTPSMLSNSLSVIGGLILGDFAVDIGWLIPEVILYMAFVTISNFTQASYELGYAVKFMRMLLLALTALFGFFGFVAGSLLILLLIVTNPTVNRRRSYLYPLIPFDKKAMLRLLLRLKKEK